MRRSLRLGLGAVVLLLLIAAGGYTAFWYYAAGRIEDGLREQAQSLKAQKLDLSWKDIAVSGYPLMFRVVLREVALHGPDGDVRLPQLLGTAGPGEFHRWDLSAPQGLTASAGNGARLGADTAQGSIAVGDETRVWLTLDKPTVDAGVQLSAKDAEIWLNLPPHPPRDHTDPALGLALDIRELSLPTIPAPFKNPLDEVSLGVTAKGQIPTGPPRLAAAAWRDKGGALEIDHLTARWGSLMVTGSGTVALDRDLQPEGAFSGGVEGYDQLMSALVASGRIRPSDASLARLALTIFARTGPNGRPQVPVSFTIQDGQMRLGPARIGPAPRINWQ